LRYDDNFGIIKLKYSLEEYEPFKFLDLRKGPLRKRDKSFIEVQNLIIPQTYLSEESTDTEKNKDLIIYL